MTQWADENSYDDLVLATSQQYGIAVPVIKGLIATESGFNAAAVKGESGGRASIGLCQLLYGTAQGLGFTGAQGSPDDLSGLYDPATNMDLGVRYLSQQYARAGSWWGAYSAYNGGWNPSRAMGTVATTPLRVVVNSNPLTYRDVAVGEYGNQPAVDRFTANVRYFQGQPPIPGDVNHAAIGDDGTGGAATVFGVSGVELLAGALLVGYLLMRGR
jgi:soluble lytic murein transglycosylase-like protein